MSDVRIVANTPGGRVIGRTLSHYRILERIGGGGMGEVFRAHDLRLPRDVAVKVLKPGLLADPGARRQFRREARALARLAHPNVEVIHDLDSVDGRDFIVAELIPGPPLSERLSEGRLPVRYALELAAQIADALEAAHRAGLVHRDVKPSNVMLSPDGAVKLIDFGLARRSRAVSPDSETLSMQGSGYELAGTLPYIAPECFRGEECGPAADLYSLGVTVHELLTGRRPFEAATERELRAKVLSEPAPAPSARRPEVPAAVDDLVRRCLEKAPSSRPGSAGHVAGELRTLAAVLPGPSVPVPVPPPPSDAAVARMAWILLMVAAAAGLAGMVRWSMDEGSLADRWVPDRVAVAMFENRTGDVTMDPLGRVAADWIASGLLATGLVEVVPPVVILQSLAALQQAGIPTGGPSTGRVLARETGAATVVWGSYYLQRDSVLFHAQVVDHRHGRLLTALGPIAGPRAAPLEAVGELRRQVSAALATRLDPHLSAPTRHTSLPPSYEAYREYVEGLALFAGRAWTRAIPHFATAAAMDSAYTYALVSEAVCHLNLGDPARVDSIVRLVGRRRSHLPPLDRSALECLESWLEGDLEWGRIAARTAASLAPPSLWTYQYALQELLCGDPAACRRVLRGLDPGRGVMRHWTPYWETLTAADHLLGEHSRELHDAQRARRQYPRSVSMLAMEARARAALGDVRGVERALDACGSLDAEPGWDAGRMLQLAARELAAHGHAGASRRVAGRGEAWYRARIEGGTGHEADSAGLAVALYLAGRWAAAATLLEGLAAAHPRNPHYQGYLGALAARGGDHARAMHHSVRIDSLRGRWSRGEGTYWQADIAALLGQRDRALALLAAARDEGHAIAFQMHSDPDLASLRGEPRFEELRRAGRR